MAVVLLSAFFPCELTPLSFLQISPFRFFPLSFSNLPYKVTPFFSPKNMLTLLLWSRLCQQRISPLIVCVFVCACVCVCVCGGVSSDVEPNYLSFILKTAWNITRAQRYSRPISRIHEGETGAYKFATVCVCNCSLGRTKKYLLTLP